MLEFNRENADIITLWNNYPCGGEYNPCRKADGEPHYPNECAIRFSTMLHNCGFDISSFKGVRCWHCKESHHFLRVEQVLVWLKKTLGEPDEVLAHPKWEHYRGKHMIVVFQDFWARQEGAALTGDHLGLFFKHELINGDLDYFERSRLVHTWELD